MVQSQNEAKHGMSNIQAILFAESFNNLFKPMSCERAKCLFPLANIPILLYSLEFLAHNRVTHVVLASTKDKSVFKPVIDTIKVAHSSKVNRLQITPVKLTQSNSLASALREINDSQVKLKDDFIIMQGDVITNASLEEALNMHMASKKSKNEEGSTVILTKIFAQVPYVNPIRDFSQELALLLDKETRQILDYGQIKNGATISNSYQLNKKHIVLKKQARQYELRSDVIDCEIAICSKQVFTHLQEDYAMRSLKEDFIMQINTSEITDDQIQAHILPRDIYFGEVTDPRTYQVITQDIIARKCYPFTVDFPVFHASQDSGNNRMTYQQKPFNKYMGCAVKRHLTSRFSDASVVGHNSEVRENSTIEFSVIGANCKIGKNVKIRRCIIWDGTEIGDDCQLEDSLIADNVVIQKGCIIEAGCRIDKDVIVKEGIILSSQTLVSCRKIIKAGGNTYDFVPVEEDDTSHFEKGAILSDLPEGYALDPHQFMGQPSPYQDDEDSSLNQSDDEEIVAVLDNDKFFHQVGELIKSTMSGEYDPDAALINLQQLKHGYSKSNDQIQGAIVPAILDEIIQRMTADMTSKQKLVVLEEQLPSFKKMLEAFLTGTEDQTNIIYLVTQCCNRNLEMLSPCFHLILQILYKEDIVKGQAILDWIESAKKKVESSKEESPEAENAEKADVDSYYGEELDDEAPIPIEVMERFLAGMKKFEAHLRSEQEAEGEYDEEAAEYGEEAEAAEYYDEEADEVA